MVVACKIVKYDARMLFYLVASILINRILQRRVYDAGCFLLLCSEYSHVIFRRVTISGESVSGSRPSEKSKT